MIKKISAFVIALVMCGAVLTGCSKSNSDGSDPASDASSQADASSSAGDSSDIATFDPSSMGGNAASQVTVPDPSLTIDGKKIDTSNFVMCTIDGTDIDFTTFRYYYYYTISQFSTNYGANLDTIKNTQGGFEDLLKQTINNIKLSRTVVDKLAKENNITLTDDDKKQIEETFTKQKTQFSSEDDYKKQLKNAYMTEDLLKKNIEYSQLSSKINSALFTNEGKYATKKADFKNIVKDGTKYASEIHIMIPYLSGAEIAEGDKSSYDKMSLQEKVTAKRQAYSALDEAGITKAKAAAKAKAEEALKKAVAGEDFNKLVKEYGWDATFESSTEGYYFPSDTANFPSELVKKTFTLKEGEVAKDILEIESYGYFIIKRIPVNMEFVEKNIDDMITQYDEPKVQKTISELAEKQEVKYCDGWDKLTADSIQ